MTRGPAPGAAGRAVHPATPRGSAIPSRRLLPGPQRGPTTAGTHPIAHLWRTRPGAGRARACLRQIHPGWQPVGCPAPRARAGPRAREAGLGRDRAPRPLRRPGLAAIPWDLSPFDQEIIANLTIEYYRDF